MRIKRVELNDFKRFTHLTVEDIPETAKLIVLVGPNGSGKTSFMEALNHYYKFAGYGDVGESNYLSKIDVKRKFEFGEWYSLASKTVDIDFYDAAYPKDVGRSNIKGHFYFRSAYRNEPDFVIDTMRKQDDPTKTVHLKSLIQNDQSVSSNYQRLIANSISELYKSENNQKDVATLRSELTGKISASIERVFEDLHFSSLGDPLQNGNFYFTKGTTKDFPYKNLSAGEKSAFDLILDLVVQSKYYPDAVYCIDEPETHMHTKLQGKVLRELYGLIPGNSQLWKLKILKKKLREQSFSLILMDEILMMIRLFVHQKLDELLWISFMSWLLETFPNCCSPKRLSSARGILVEQREKVLIVASILQYLKILIRRHISCLAVLVRRLSISLMPISERC